VVVVVDSHSSAALAAVIVATKLGRPVAGIEGQPDEAEGSNATLIRQLADIELAPNAPAIVGWFRDTYTERP
jgi:hypothetical protein